MRNPKASRWSVGCGGVVAGVFAVGWVGITGLGTVLCYASWVEMIWVRHTYQPAPGFVERVGVSRTAGSRRGSSYTADVSYRYTVSGTVYRGDRFSVWEDWEDRPTLEARLRQFPPDTPATVWYLPSDPTRSCLDPDANNFPYLLFIFLVPFQLIAGVILWCAYHTVRTRFVGLDRSLSRAYFVVDRPDMVVARLGNGSPRFMAVVGFGITCFLSIFLIVFTVGFVCPPWVVPMVFVIAAGVGAALSVRDRLRHPPALDRFVLDRLSGRFQLGESEGVVADIREVAVVSTIRRNDDGDPEERFEVVLRMRQGPDRALFVGLFTATDAEALRGLINDRLGITGSTEGPEHGSP